MKLSLAAITFDVGAAGLDFVAGLIWLGYGAPITGLLFMLLAAAMVAFAAKLLADLR